MKVTVHVSGSCECGCILYLGKGETLFCANEQCQCYDKKFKMPTIELEEA